MSKILWRTVYVLFELLSILVGGVTLLVIIVGSPIWTMLFIFTGFNIISKVSQLIHKIVQVETYIEQQYGKVNDV